MKRRKKMEKNKNWFKEKVLTSWKNFFFLSVSETLQEDNIVKMLNKLKDQLASIGNDVVNLSERTFFTETDKKRLRNIAKICEQLTINLKGHKQQGEEYSLKLNTLSGQISKKHEEITKRVSVTKELISEQKKNHEDTASLLKENQIVNELIKETFPILIEKVDRLLERPKEQEGSPISSKQFEVLKQDIANLQDTKVNEDLATLMANFKTLMEDKGVKECGNCGGLAPMDAKFCPQCGVKMG